MNATQRLTAVERFLTLFTRVQAGEGRSVGILALQAFTLMVAYYLIRPVREALILTEGTAELRSYAVGVQALLLLLILPVYGQLVRRCASNRVFQFVMAFFALNLVAFSLIGHAGIRFSFVFFVWASIFAVMAVAQFWAFATDLLDVTSGTRLFGVIATGVSAGAWVGANLASAGFKSIGPYGLMLASAGVLCISIYLSERARRVVRAAVARRAARIRFDFRLTRSAPRSAGSADSPWSAQPLPDRHRGAGRADQLDHLDRRLRADRTGSPAWLASSRPQDPGAYIGAFMGSYFSTITLVGFLIQLLLVSRIINGAGLSRALLVTPVVILGGFCLIGFLPVFALLQSALVVQRSLDYSLLNTTRSALLLPTTRDEKYQAKTAIDTLFYRAGDLLSTLGVFIGLQVFDEPRLQFVWLIVILSATMTAVAWLIGREYARRFGEGAAGSRGGELPLGDRRAVLAQ